ncbi:required for drug-induced death protein 1 [Hyperolius riggenbachi]|uniref:required for drug-induced death protein 1 n=1 Tax=Hyperolius riggenbachi TaxID=752182 RepID=UPI0035A38609
MAGGPKSKGKKRSKWRKLKPKKEHILLQEEEEMVEVSSSQPETPGQSAEDKKSKKKKKKRSSKKVHLSPLPDKYDPLEEGVAEEAESKKDKKYRRKQKVKKYAKNVGKAVRASCRYLLIGLQGLATAYISPFNTTVMMSAVVPR